MPSIIDYPIVLQRMQQQGFKSLYHNSGAFALPPQPPASVVAWIGPPDPSIRPEALPLVRQIRSPFEFELAMMTRWQWEKNFAAGVAWLMPMSHWAFECSQDWMVSLLKSNGLDPKALRNRNDAAAIQFELAEGHEFGFFLRDLLTNLISSDFTLAFPGQSTLCTVHHHKQLWWSTQDGTVFAALESLARDCAAVP